MTMLARVAPARHSSLSLAFTIEPAGEAHLGAMTMIYRDQVMDGLGTWEDPIPDPAEIGRRLAALRAAGLPAYVALDAQRRVLGFAWARPFRDRAAYRDTVEDSIFVARRARRHGVGKALLGAVVDACTQLGCQQMIAVVGDARNLPSIRLHESLGFKAVGFLPGAGAKPGGRVDVVLLQRALGDGVVVPLRRRS
jgi:phosphinothricin acetyltransferase